MYMYTFTCSSITLQLTKHEGQFCVFILAVSKAEAAQQRNLLSKRRLSVTVVVRVGVAEAEGAEAGAHSTNAGVAVAGAVVAAVVVVVVAVVVGAGAGAGAEGAGAGIEAPTVYSCTGATLAGLGLLIAAAIDAAAEAGAAHIIGRPTRESRANDMNAMSA